MKKIIFKFWLVNLLISILLFFLYKIVMMETKQTDATFLGNILYIIDILLNLGFSLIYLAVMVFSSLTFFLNLAEKIRNNYFFSFLTFSGIPIFCVIYLMANVSIDLYQYKESLLIRLISFSIMYLLCTGVEFLIFRKKIKSLKYSHSIKM
ncbi:hypothetical protein NK212_11740 [Elizabethkingia sp. S0634]|uniref:hypothetical protein n=1 Tax=Elizabethkingia sp. S0634 TaxID=2957806 RepID=UPI00209DB81C|nr:hypothetical protein [Elizabethkingia sp. S0634]MCP1252524.1 hypothetical protein [Elizabethkingia sp. S0634]